MAWESVMPVLMTAAVVVSVPGLIGTWLLDAHIGRIQGDDAKRAEHERLQPLSNLLWAGVFIGALLFVIIVVGEGITSDIPDWERDAWDGCKPGRC